MYVSTWCWVLSAALAFMFWAFFLAFSCYWKHFFFKMWVFLDASISIIPISFHDEWLDWRMSERKYLDEIWFVLNGSCFKIFFSLSIFPEIHPACCLEGAIGVGESLSVQLSIFGWFVLDFAADDVWFVTWKTAMSCGNYFFRLAWRKANYLVMNSSLLVTVGEGTIRGQVVVGRFTWEFEAEGSNIFDCFFILAWKITISLSKHYLHCCIIIRMVLFDWFL